MPKKNYPSTGVLFGVFFCFTMCTAFNQVYAQVTSSLAKSSAEWQLDANTGGVRLYHSIGECNGKKVVFLKMINSNNYNVEVSWKEVFTTQLESNLKGYRGTRMMLLTSGETAQAACANPAQKELIIFPQQINPTYAAKVTSFGFEEVEVTKAN